MANYWKLFKQAKAFYFNLGRIKCPALSSEEIIFDWRGFRHFLHRSKGKRPIADQIRRFKLLTQIRTIIEKAAVFNSEEGKDGAQFLSLVHKTETGSITIVVLKDSNKYYFISIMDRE
jgi:hypothetical protein